MAYVGKEARGSPYMADNARNPLLPCIFVWRWAREEVSRSNRLSPRLPHAVRPPRQCGNAARR